MSNYVPRPKDCTDRCFYGDECPDTCSRIKAMLAEPKLTDIDYESFISCDVMTMGR